jgi:N-acetylated-alpha-linked acidic dipeptidase
MRLASADLLPFEYTNFADTIQTYVKELKTLAQKSRDEIIERIRELDEGVFAAMSDPRVKSVPPPREAVPPFLNFAPLDNATDALNRAAADYRKALEKAAANGGASLAKASLAEVNQALMQSEHQLTLEQGLPGRPWFKHFVDAPGQYTGYEAKTLPAVREPIEQKQWKDVDAQIAVTARVLEAEAAHILSVAQKLDAAVSK